MSEGLRTWGLRGLLLALLAGMVVWVSSCTEWVEVEVPLPPRGEAARNRHHVTQELLRRMGTTVATPTSLAQLPPPGATLVLTSWQWDFFPDRVQRLQRWVEGGGHLVMFSSALQQERLKGWLPVEQVARTRPPVERRQDEDEDDDEGEQEDGAPGARDPSVLLRRFQLPCHDAAEPVGVAPYYPGDARHYRLCGFVTPGVQLRARTPVLWSLDARTGPLLMRVAQGRGSVTVIQPWSLMDNDRVLESGNGLATVAALQARRGHTVWFVSEEARPSLFAWLWSEAWVAVLLAALALAFALWRGAPRFGPLAAPPAPGRRSMAEQIAGTAQFLRRQGPEALLVAQVRALDAAARSHIHPYDRLDRGQRAAAIARHTGLEASALASALDPRLARRRTDLPATLELLETARRRLAQRAPVSRPSKKD